MNCIQRTIVNCNNFDTHWSLYKLIEKCRIYAFLSSHCVQEQQIEMANMYSPTFPGSLTASENLCQGHTSENAITTVKPTCSTKQLPSYDENDRIGDFSRPHSLPTVADRHTDLNCISPAVMAALLSGEFSHIVEQFMVVDCRYPYEFEGGHIREAINIWNSDSLLTHFFYDNKQKTVTHSSQKRKILILHCEFSLERGPTMLRFL